MALTLSSSHVVVSGNLYYAMTHSPFPMTEEYSHALSWEAATERLISAGSVSVAEANSTALALSSGAGMEISLPIATMQRKRVKSTISQTRDRYRRFRSRLSSEIRNSDVLPEPLAVRVTAELDKRLDLDLDALLENSSPKLKLGLSPGKLDEELLEFWNNFSQGKSADIKRIFLGGEDIAYQHKYTQKGKMEQKRSPFYDWSNPSDDFSPVERVRRSLKNNFAAQLGPGDDDTGTGDNNHHGPSMSIGGGARRNRVRIRPVEWRWAPTLNLLPVTPSLCFRPKIW